MPHAFARACRVMNAKDEKRRFTEMNRSYGIQL
jgi:hypothetical protein